MTSTFPPRRSRQATVLAPLALLFALLTSAISGAAGVTWHPSVDAAMASAKDANIPIFVAINMDGERANDEAVTKLYKDRTFASLAENTAPVFGSRFDHGGADRSCSRAPGDTTCDQHRAIEKAIRKAYLTTQGEEVIAPQHLWVSPEGKVLLSVPYKISMGEMEWCFVEAIRRLNPEFSWKLSSAARAPKRLVVDGVKQGPSEADLTPPTKKEVLALIEELRKTPVRELLGKIEDVLKVLRSPEKKAISYIESLLMAGGGGGGGGRGGRGGRGPGGGGGGWANQRKIRIVQAIGRYSPPEYADIVTPLLKDASVEIRSNAAVALELLADAGAASALSSALKKEDEMEARREIIRALASCGRSGSKGVGPVKKYWDRKKEPLEVRASAVIGSEYLEDREEVVALCRSALLSNDADVRSASAYVIGTRREVDLKDLLETVLVDEKNAAAKEAIEQAIQVLGGGDADVLRPISSRVTGSDLPRERA